MQNWTWGNDYRPGTAADNLVYTRKQLQATGQLQPGGWKGGLRWRAYNARKLPRLLLLARGWEPIPNSVMASA